MSDNVILGTGPFKFLDYYTNTETDKKIFAGRERDIREIVARISHYV